MLYLSRPWILLRTPRSKLAQNVAMILNFKHKVPRSVAVTAEVTGGSSRLGEVVAEEGEGLAHS